MKKLLGWRLKGTHPENGVVAFSKKYLEHEDGHQITVWAGVEESTEHYDVGEDENYAVEVQDENGEVVYGESFKNSTSAEVKVAELMIEIETGETDIMD